MSEHELISTVGRLRRRLRGHAHLFEDPASYVDGVEDALELVERAMTGEDVGGDAEVGPVGLDDGLERTA